MDAAARRRTFDIPKSDSVGLAEWTSRIKALQRQVDEDEEAETRRLEEEIIASRMSRMRRSTLQPRPVSYDPSVNKPPRLLSPTPDVDHHQSAEDKQRDREATMRRLMGERSPVMPDFPRSKTPSDNQPPAPPKPSTSVNNPPQEPTSLAALMGSRETGPRMNKRAPQHDAHDPTQFEQRNITSQHPVFGKNAVAMPGLVQRSPGPRSRASPRPADVGVAPQMQSTPLSNLRERKISTPAVARRYVEKIESESSPKPSPSPKLRDTREHIRERTVSTPSGPGPSSQRYTSQPKPSPPNVQSTPTSKRLSPLPQAHNSLSTPSTPNPHRHSFTSGSLRNEVKSDPLRKSSPSTSQSGRTETELSSKSNNQTLPILAPDFRRSPSPSMTSASPSRPPTIIGTPTLARPVEPKLHPSLHGPKLASYNTSPAFSDRTPPKGITPSLSRLQGRGFVQNMIKVSAELEYSAGTSPSSTPERSRSEAQKKTSVLDRWTVVEPAASTPVISSTPVPMRKAKTLDSINATPGFSSVSRSSPTPRQISIPGRKSQTFENEPDPTPPLSKSPSKGILVTSKEKEKPVSTTPPTTPHVSGVGSSNTLVSYVKPMKTGDSEPQSPVRSKTPIANDGADELGIRKRKSSGKLKEKFVSFAAPPPTSKAKSVVEVLPSPSKPLSHPTKDRAKKPKRVKSTAVIVNEDKDGKSAHVLRGEVPPNTVYPDPLKASSTSPTPALSTSLPPKPPPACQDLPSSLPTEFPPSSSSSPYCQHSEPALPPRSRSPSPQPAARPSGQTVPHQEHFPPSPKQKIVDRWANGPIIGVKPAFKGKGRQTSSSTSPSPTPTGGAFGKIALPGLSEASTPSSCGTDKPEDCAPTSPLPAREPPQEKQEERSSKERRPGAEKPKPRRPPVPHKPSRIPSTGNRATVMDVAQVWSQHEKQNSQDVSSPPPTSPSSPLESHPARSMGTQDRLNNQSVLEGEGGREGEEQEKHDGPPVMDDKATIPGRGIQPSMLTSFVVETPKESGEDRDASLNLPNLLSPAEKRKSSWEKYSELIMPALEEEWTPSPSPMPTLNKLPPAILDTKGELATVTVTEVKRFNESKVDYLPIGLLAATLGSERVVKVSPADLITFDFPNYAIPNIDVRPLLKSIPKPGSANPGVMTISVDVLSIVGLASNAIGDDTSVFYDTEILAIIQRAKVKSSGLVDTKVWGWMGKDAVVGPKEERALADLAKRYGTKLISVKQYHEPVDMVIVLGGILAIRQGTRAHWSSENTTMHLVRSANGATFIDEQHLSIQNLCSGFSYCLSILQMFYVWNGRGARHEEKKAAFDYAVGLCGDADSVIVLNEGENDEDEMFWAVLGDGDREYAKASHWVWRAEANTNDPQLWKISASQGHRFAHIPANSNPSLEDGVFVLDAVWELFVLVGAEARSIREDIWLALGTAKALASSVGRSRPYVPPVYVLVLPSQVPRDLRLAIRGLGFEVLAEDGPVEHMNILSASQALDHLNTNQWHKTALGDKTLLPLGISPRDLE